MEIFDHENIPKGQPFAKFIYVQLFTLIKITRVKIQKWTKVLYFFEYMFPVILLRYFATGVESRQTFHRHHAASIKTTVLACHARIAWAAVLSKHHTQGRRKQLCIGWTEMGWGWGGGSGRISFLPHSIDLNARNLFSNSADMHRWQKSRTGTVVPPSRVVRAGVGGGLGQRPWRRGFRGFALKHFWKLEGKSCTLCIFGIVSHNIMLLHFVRRGPAMNPQLY